MDEPARKEVETLLEEAENYLVQAKTRMGNDVKNFAAVLAFEYATKARDRSKTLRQDEEFYEDANRRVEAVLEEIRKLPLSLQREKSSKEVEYEQGDVAGG